MLRTQGLNISVNQYGEWVCVTQLWRWFIFGMSEGTLNEKKTHLVLSEKEKNVPMINEWRTTIGFIRKETPLLTGMLLTLLYAGKLLET